MKRNEKTVRGYTDLNHAGIVYFTGTGGTQRGAMHLKAAMEAYGVTVSDLALDKSMLNKGSGSVYDADMLIILFPVHAFDAPKPVYDFIKLLPEALGKPAAVVAVSGAGEALPNRGCRIHTIKKLERKGYCVVYENMAVMPSNWAETVPEDLAEELLTYLPKKMQRVAKDLCEGHVKRANPGIASRVISGLGEAAKLPIGFSLMGRFFYANNSCTSCGWCAGNCPNANIIMPEDRPAFGGECLLCMRCIYGCPEQAIQLKRLKFMKLAGGYDLDRMEKNITAKQKEADAGTSAKVHYEGKGTWEAVYSYLNEEETE